LETFPKCGAGFHYCPILDPLSCSALTLRLYPSLNQDLRNFKVETNC
jgi:hypothetical protein